MLPFLVLRLRSLLPTSAFNSFGTADKLWFIFFQKKKRGWGARGLRWLSAVLCGCKSHQLAAKIELQNNGPEMLLGVSL